MGPDLSADHAVNRLIVLSDAPLDSRSAVLTILFENL